MLSVVNGMFVAMAVAIGTVATAATDHGHSAGDRSARRPERVRIVGRPASLTGWSLTGLCL